MAERDDRVLPSMKWVSLVVVLVLLPALVILWGMPSKTADLWAWTIKPDLTPIFMGAGYGAGAYFFGRVFLSRKWHVGAVGVFSAAAFATLMLITTLIHYDKFNHGDAPTLATIAFYGWVGVYIASPFVVFGLWWLNQRTDPRTPEPGDVIVPPAVRLGARIVAVGALLVAGAVLIDPSIATGTIGGGAGGHSPASPKAGNWGWLLTPLTARVLACFTAQVGIGFLMLSLDERWSSWKLLVQTFLIAVVLLLVGAARAWAAFDTGNWLTYAYVAGLGGGALALAGLYLSMERLRA